jgi:hypothetical protein
MPTPSLVTRSHKENFFNHASGTSILMPRTTLFPTVKVWESPARFKLTCAPLNSKLLRPALSRLTPRAWKQRFLIACWTTSVPGERSYDHGSRIRSCPVGTSSCSSAVVSSVVEHPTFTAQTSLLETFLCARPARHALQALRSPDFAPSSETPGGYVGQAVLGLWRTEWWKIEVLLLVRTAHRRRGIGGAPLGDLRLHYTID